MDGMVKQLGRVVFCAALAGLLFALAWSLRDPDGNTGIFGILAGQPDTETAVSRMDAEAVKKVLSEEKPEISCRDDGLSGTGIHAGDTVSFKDIIEAEEKTGASAVKLEFPDGIRVDRILDADGAKLEGFQRGSQTAVFPLAGCYTLTVTATYEKGCSTTKDIRIIVKQ